MTKYHILKTGASQERFGNEASTQFLLSPNKQSVINDLYCRMNSQVTGNILGVCGLDLPLGKKISHFEATVSWKQFFIQLSTPFLGACFYSHAYTISLSLVHECHYSPEGMAPTLLFSSSSVCSSCRSLYTSTSCNTRWLSTITVVHAWSIP